MRRFVGAALAASLAVMPLQAGAQSVNMEMPSLFRHKGPPPGDTLPPPPFLSKPLPTDATKPTAPGSDVSAKPHAKTACRTVRKRVSVDGRSVSKRERVCG